MRSSWGRRAIETRLILAYGLIAILFVVGIAAALMIRYNSRTQVKRRARVRDKLRGDLRRQNYLAERGE